ncbi:protein-L-isoaspartate(D-aspartate) O-methyltransferase [Roseimaritima ulvae]|uniref:Protein-L-isoaspartate O-methyltransferase n=1 Tax=Roseimaritima ulvae TaxID=980254 RepID=A0A5B9QZ23_9BACT|nr:protein-L-isoaspartate(D-aspartate) O-methyltransferase [Roseimaritima ulvae]QEG43110.1 Protein-L-isoaspartate O-methyltransferase [Roseimaritima ulvae]
MNTVDWPAQRCNMVEHQLRARGVRDRAVLDAMLRVPREAFVPEAVRESAYQDSPLPIAAGQTISQPYIVAFMIEALGLQGGEWVLEIGAGSGYAAAVLSEIAAEVYTVERIEELAAGAAQTIRSLGIRNVQVRCGDGTLGWPEHAPYQAIVVAAGGPEVPESLQTQLQIGGRLVIPVGGDPTSQGLIRITRISETQFDGEDIADVRFVPLIGAQGWGKPSSDKWPQSRNLPFNAMVDRK